MWTECSLRKVFGYYYESPSMWPCKLPTIYCSEAPYGFGLDTYNYLSCEISN